MPLKQLISSVFGSDARTVVDSSALLTDEALLDDALVSVKLVTAFDRVNAADLVAMRQTIAFVQDLAAGKVTDFTSEVIRKTLQRPIRIPSEFVKSLTLSSNRPRPPQAPDPLLDAAVRHRTALLAEQGHLKTAYERIMGLHPDQFELKPSKIKADRPLVAAHDSSRVASTREGMGSVIDSVGANPTFLAVSQAAIERLGSDVRQTLEKAHIDVSGASVSHVITAIKRQWQDVSRQLAPYQVPTPAKVFRVGVHVFAVRDIVFD
jgi:hypothetical protein